MQLDARQGRTMQPMREGIEHHSRPAMQSGDMQTVQRHIHKARKQTLNQHIATDHATHQITDRAHMPKRHQRAEIAITELGQSLARQPRLQRLEQKAGLLMRRLRARRHIALFFRPGARCAVTQRKNIIVGLGLQGGAYIQLTQTIDGQTVRPAP